MTGKRHEACIVALDDCFDCISAADKLTKAGFEIRRFSSLFPDFATVREQSVKDNRVISECHKNQFLLFTTDKEMRSVHVVELLKTDIGVVATSSNNDPDAITHNGGIILSDEPTSSPQRFGRYTGPAIEQCAPHVPDCIERRPP